VTFSGVTEKILDQRQSNEHSIKGSSSYPFNMEEETPAEAASSICDWDSEVRTVESTSLSTHHQMI